MKDLALRSRLSGGGSKPPQVAFIKSGGHERWGKVRTNLAGMDQKDEQN